MTSITPEITSVQSEDLSWDRSSPGVPYADSGTLDVSLFTQAQHFANGFIPAGTVLGKKTSTGLLGPYLDTAADGRQTAVGILRHSVPAVNPTGALRSKFAVAVLAAFGVVDPTRLPFTSGNAANGGFLDAAGKADLPRLHFTS